MEKKGGGWVSAVILGVPLIVAIVLAVLMGYVNISKWTGGVRVSFGWQSEEMAELKDKLQLSFDALKNRLEALRKELAEVIEEY